MTSFTRLAALLASVVLVAACGDSSDSSTDDAGRGDTAVTPDSSTDARADSAIGADTAPGDTTTSDTGPDAPDAPPCPTLKPSRLSACPQVDQICFYACGSVLRCTAAGWDDDLTVDGGPPCP